MPEPPPGTRWAGIGQVVLAVPKDWSDGASRSATSRRGHRLLPRRCDPLRARGRPASHRWRSATSRFDRPHIVALGARRRGRRTRGADRRSACAEPSPMTCALDVAVPDLDAYFRITAARDRRLTSDLEAMRDTLTVLPDDQTAVPWSELAPAVRRGRLRGDGGAGLDPSSRTGCTDGLLRLVGVDRAAGRTRVAGGTRSPSTWSVAATARTPIRSMSRRARATISVRTASTTSSAGRPKEAREQGWPTDPLDAVEGVPMRRPGVTSGSSTSPSSTRSTTGWPASPLRTPRAARSSIMRVEELVKDAWAMTGPRPAADSHGVTIPAASPVFPFPWSGRTDRRLVDRAGAVAGHGRATSASGRASSWG